MTSKDARETMNAAGARRDEKAANIAAYAGLSLEELEAKADDLAVTIDGMTRGTDEYREANAESRRLDDAIFAMTR